MDRKNKYPIDQGELAVQRLMTECESDELVRLERIIPLYPKIAHLKLVPPPDIPDVAA